MEVSSEYRARPLHLSGRGLAAQLRQHNHKTRNQPPPQPSNQPVPLSPNTLLAFENPEDIEHHLVHRIPHDSPTSAGYADGQAIFDLYNNSPASNHFLRDRETEAGTSGVGRQPSIKLIRPEEDGEEADDEAYGGTEEAGGRGSWNSAYSEGQSGDGVEWVRGSTVSAMTVESEMDPFVFSVSWALDTRLTVATGATGAKG